MLLFYAQYTASKLGVAGLTVTVDVWRIDADGNATRVVEAAAATHIAQGVYSYGLADFDLEAYEYLAIFTTANLLVDVRDIPALWTQFGRDAQVTVETNLDKTGYSLAVGSGAVAPRPQEGTRIYIQKGDTLAISITGLGDLAGYPILDFMLKTDKSLADGAAIIWIRLDAVSARLLIFKGAAAVNPTHGDLTINNSLSGNITIAVHALESSQLVATATLYYEVQGITAGGTVVTLRSGKATINDDVIKAIS